MRLVDSSIRYPVTVTVGVILILLFGLLALFRIPVQLIPDVEQPRVLVTTIWPGASPEEIETEIVQEQEEQLKTLEGLVKMTSASNQSVGTVTLQFQTGTIPDAAILRVSNQLQQVPSYPANALKPVLTTGEQAEGASGWFVLRAIEGADVDIEKERDFAIDVIKPTIERVPGIASVLVFGGRESEIQVVVDAQALAVRGLTLSQVARALDTENRDVSAGDFDEGKRAYVVRTVGEFTSIDDIEKVVISWRGEGGGAPVYVRDVATVGLAYKDPDAVVRGKGVPTMAIAPVRQPGTNTLLVMSDVEAAVEVMNAGPLRERGLVMEVAFSEADYIGEAIGLVQRNIFVGGALAVITLLLFLRSISSTLVIGLAIPVSVIGTFLAMTALGRNINVVSLAGLAFAVGLIVDASIVVLENIYRHMQMGKPRRQAAYDGAVEVWGAVLASVLTTVAVFLPVVFVQEEAGQLFQDIAVAVTSAVLISLVVSITLIPSLAARILSAVEVEEPSREGRAGDARRHWRNLWGLTKFAHGLNERIGDLIYRLAGAPVARIVVIVVLTVGAIVAAWMLMPETEYLPTGNQNFAFAILVPPPGYNTGEYVSMAEHLDRDLEPYWLAEPLSPEAEALDAPTIDSTFFVAFPGGAFMGTILDVEYRDVASRILPVIQRSLSTIPGTFGIVQQPSIFQRGAEAGRAIDIDLTGPDLVRLLELGGRVFGSVMATIPGAQAQPIPGLDLGNPEIRIIPDRERAAELGMTAQDIGFALNALVDGVKVSEYQFEGRAIDLTLRGADPYASRSQQIGNLSIATPTGRVVSIADLGRQVETTGPSQIIHIERQRAVTIRVIPPGEMPLEGVMSQINDQILGPIYADGSLGGLYRADLSGTADKLTTARVALQANFILALVVTYLLMAALFESFLYPFVILFSVPFAAVGGFVGLALVSRFITYQALDVIAMLGFIILIGIVVNNAILIVHQTLNYLREGKMGRREALREAVSNRVRPIFMSTLTSISGMAPLVLFTGPGSEIYRGLGSVVVGGLAFSTVFTLLLVPAVFSVVMDTSDAVKRMFGRGPERAVGA